MTGLRKVVSTAGIVVWILALFGFIATGLGWVPAVVTVTLLTGEPATAYVESCADADRAARSTDCSGTWVTEAGARRSGHISGVGPGDVGHHVAVRVGPLGPYAVPITGYWQIYAPIPFLTWLGYLVLRRRFGGRAAAVEPA